jgi:hypothetical protein
MAQQTLEEAAERYEKIRLAHDENYINSNDIQDLKESYYYKGRRDECIKCQQEQDKNKYNEEEVKQIIETTLIEYSDIVLADIPHWFEQFKKK